ncbi:glycosyltransferase family A protein [Streptomyces sp. DSM 44917]|uniref:Glycosyltransferase family A protein n=1 Tax=Streptomyces boetiae TaxID=3075541 RepID=A0ABU2LFU6_9ACTN|nr:glycosyltransferase family A protein [Streptomyces sp. DSM 44917]MDT0310458.1 glycosyltransferase family A protein [Streptomyces sp. DSM 44917]
MRVDVVTAAHAPHARYLAAAWASLRAQTHHAWRWLIQLDGTDERPLRSALEACGAAADRRVEIAAHRTAVGPANSRNLALARATAPLIQNLDADDELEPAALALLSAALTERPATGYAAGQARDLLPGGRLRPHRLPLRDGPLPRGILLEHWNTAAGRYRLPLHPAGVMWRRGLLECLGGWSAMHGMEDTATLIAASARTAGVLLPAPTLRYRKHPQQISGQNSKFAGGGGADSAYPAARPPPADSPRLAPAAHRGRDRGPRLKPAAPGARQGGQRARSCRAWGRARCGVGARLVTRWCGSVTEVGDA